MLMSREYRKQIAFRKTIEDVLYNDAPVSMRPLFAEIATKTGKPKFLTDIAPAIVDMMYMEYAPEKWLSKTGAIPYSMVNDVLTHSGSLSSLADAIIAMYGANWDNIYSAYTDEYEPLHNYDMYQKATYNSAENHNGADTLTKSGSETNTKAGTETNTKAGTETNTKTGKEIDTKSGTETTTYAGDETLTKAGSESLTKEGSEKTTYNSNTENQVSAFNSTSYQDATKAIHSGADSVTYGEDANDTADARVDTTSFDERTDTKSFTNRTDSLGFTDRKDELSFDQRKDELSFNNRTDTLSFTNRTDTLSYTNRSDSQSYNSAFSHSGYDELERSGNIGVTTSQQMLQSEIDLRQYNFIMQVFRDVTDLLGLPIY